MKAIISICLLFSCFGGFGQTRIDTSELDKTVIKEDKGYGIFSMFDGNPGKAALYSLIAPGGGQLFNKRYLKAPIVWGLEGTAIGFIIYNTQTYRDYNRIYKGLIDGSVPVEVNGVPLDAAGFKPIRDNARKNLEFSYVALLVIHIINIADAFVDRHLIEFDVEDDIGFKIQPATNSFGIKLAIALN